MSSLQELLATVEQLRAPDGCPWDREQTHESLMTCLLEECAEVLQAVDRGDSDNLREELGDLLLQVVLHSQIAQEENRFDFEQVAAEINEKLIRRHPHVFAKDSSSAQNEADAVSRWEAIKKAEKKAKGIIESPSLFKQKPEQLGALMRTWNVCKQAQRKEIALEAHFPIKESPSEEDVFGLLIFQAVRAAQAKGINAEQALRKFTQQVVDAAELAHLDDTSDSRTSD